MKLNANNLANEKLKDTILETYINDEIKKIENKIILAHKMRKSCVWYEIKKPLTINYIDVMKGVNKELKKNNFKTVMYEDGLFYIDWTKKCY